MCKYNNHSLVSSETKKVFGIGLGRTGTKSLTRALYLLGIHVTHFPIEKDIYTKLRQGKCDFEILQRFDGITDITVAPCYAQLDRLYPGSRFVLTLRDKEAWLDSMERLLGRKPVLDESVPGNKLYLKIRNFLQEEVYGTRSFSREKMSNVYDLHTKNVIDYFRDSPESLLIIDVTRGEGWEKLCPFLGKAVPEEPFPNIDFNRDWSLADWRKYH